MAKQIALNATQIQRFKCWNRKKHTLMSEVENVFQILDYKNPAIVIAK
jgi:hypothetical protein